MQLQLLSSKHHASCRGVRHCLWNVRAVCFWSLIRTLSIACGLLVQWAASVHSHNEHRLIF